MIRMSLQDFDQKTRIYRSYPDVAFSVNNNLCADVTVGQELLKQHCSENFSGWPEGSDVGPGITDTLSGPCISKATDLCCLRSSWLTITSTHRLLMTLKANVGIWSIYSKLRDSAYHELIKSLHDGRTKQQRKVRTCCAWRQSRPRPHNATNTKKLQ